MTIGEIIIYLIFIIPLVVISIILLALVVYLVVITLWWWANEFSPEKGIFSFFKKIGWFSLILIISMLILLYPFLHILFIGIIGHLIELILELFLNNVWNKKII